MKRVKDHRYLYIRNGWLTFRRSVPEQFRFAFDGKREVWEALETTDLQKARYRMVPYLADFDDRLSKAKGAAISGGSRADQIERPSNVEVEEAVRV